MPAYPGPTANLKGTQRRSGRACTVWINAQMRGEITAVQWEVQIAQIGVEIPGTWQDENKPGAESRAGTFAFQDVDDHWRRYVWAFLDARRRGDRATAAQFPEFDIITQIDDIGAPAVSRWALRGCQLFSYSGGGGGAEDLLTSSVPFTYREDGPVDSFEYTDAGVVTFS
jgi:hypothetical protein